MKKRPSLTSAAHDPVSALARNRVSAALAVVSVPMAVVDLAPSPDPLQSPIVAANQACESLLVEPGQTVVGRRLLDFTAPDRVDIARENMGSLESRVEGFQVAGSAVPDNGPEFSALFSVRRLHLDDGSDLSVIVVLPEDSAAASLEQAIALSALADVTFLVTDHDWGVEHCSDRVSGVSDDAAATVPLLGSVHPADAPAFILAAIEATTSGRAVATRGRFRDEDLSWHDNLCLVAPLCEHDPPRLGVLLTSATSAPETLISARATEFEQHLRRIAMEVRAAHLLPPVAETLPLERIRQFEELSERQREIVTRLLNGERVSQIARAMFLSPSTVRNHLTATFRKFGVHSQVELIALLKGDSSSV